MVCDCRDFCLKFSGGTDAQKPDEAQAKPVKAIAQTNLPQKIGRFGAVVPHPPAKRKVDHQTGGKFGCSDQAHAGGGLYKNTSAAPVFGKAGKPQQA